MTVCVMFVSRMTCIIFNPRAGAHIVRSAKDIIPYFKYQLYMKDPSHKLIVPNGINTPSMTEVNLCRRWDLNSQPLIDQRVKPLSRSPSEHSVLSLLCLHIVSCKCVCILTYNFIYIGESGEKADTTSPEVHRSQGDSATDLG